jgi:hypothetical protein
MNVFKAPETLELKASHLLYHLKQASSTFCPGYFGDRVLLFAKVGLHHDLPM